MSNSSYYETMYILRPDIAEEEVETHITKYNDLLLKAEGKVLDSQMRGKRRLAYPIGKDKEGIYVQLSHQGNGQHIAVLEKAMRLSEDVIRYLTVKQDGPLPTPKNNTSSKNDKEELAEEKEAKSTTENNKKEAEEKEAKSTTENNKEEAEVAKETEEAKDQ